MDNFQEIKIKSSYEEKMENEDYKTRIKNKVLIILKKIKIIFIIISLFLTSQKILLSNLFGFYCYIHSLKGCDGTQIKCFSENIVQLLIKVAIYEIIGLIIISFNISLILNKLGSIYHLLYITIFYILMRFYDYGTDFKNHGYYNYMLLIFGTIVMVSFFCFLFSLYKCFKNKKVIQLTIIFTSVVSIIIGWMIFINESYSCKDWDLALNNTRIDNNKHGEICHIIKPKNCGINAYNNIFDMTRLLNIKCENRNVKDERERLLKYLPHKDKLKNTKIFGFPITTSIDAHDEINVMHYSQMVLSNIIDMENEEMTKNLTEENYPEVFLEYKDLSTPGEIKIKVKYNETLSLERKKLENKNSLYKNILIIYIDALSRAHFKRKMVKTQKFFEQFMKSEKIKSFQFLKYQNFGPWTQINGIPMFYGENIKNMNGTSIVKYLKENGYITGQSMSICQREVFWTEQKSITKLITENFDNENQSLFCDPNYFDQITPWPFDKGAFSILRRCFYGKDSFEYNFEYFQQFWTNYQNNRKYFRLDFIDAHEGTGEVIKYLDQPLFNFLNFFYSNGFLHDTVIFFLSDHGNHMPGFYFFFNFNDFYLEKLLGVLIILFPYVDNEEYLIENQQILITPFDVYGTLINIIFGDDFNAPYTQYSKSLLHKINSNERFCNNYPLEKNEHCRCINVTKYI